MNKKTALITGGSTGIGLALVKHFLNAGYKVITTSRLGSADGFEHPDLIFFPMELAKLASIKTAATNISKVGNTIDVLINNAGIAADIGATTPNYETFTDTLNVNLTGQVFFTEAVLPLLKTGGAILNISSAMGLPENIEPDSPAYRISKSALNIYTKMLSQRLLEQNIKVGAIHPGWVKTRLGGDAAPVSPTESANAIYAQYEQGIGTGTFINAITGDCHLL